MDRHYFQRLVDRGGDYFEDGNYEKAIDFFVRALEMDTDCPEALEGLGQAYAALCNWSQAVKAFSELVGVVPESGFASYLLGHALGGLGEHKKALVELRRASHLGYDDGELHAAIGYSLHMSGRVESAIREYRQALRDDPQDTITLFNMGKALAGTGDFGEAQSALEAAAQIDPDDASTWIALGEIREDLDQLDLALQAYRRAVELDPANPDSRCLAARICTLLGRLDEAEWEFSQVVAEVPDDGSAWAGLGEVLLAGSRFDEALAAFEKAVESDPTSPFVLSGYVCACEHTGSLDEAQTVLARAVEREPECGDLWYLLAGIEASRRNPEHALKAYERVLKLDPSVPGAHSGVAWSLMTLGKEPSRAKRHLMKSTALDPDWYYPYMQLAELALKDCDLAAAAKWYRKARDLRPSDPDALEILQSPDVMELLERHK